MSDTIEHFIRDTDQECQNIGQSLRMLVDQIENPSVQEEPQIPED